jgi:hypothetical protein
MYDRIYASHTPMGEHHRRITDRPRLRGLEQGGAIVVAALGIGIIGTILLVIIIIAVILLLRRRR